MSEQNKREFPLIELTDEQLSPVVGGVINVFYDVPKEDYWKYTCHSCGHSAVTVGRPNVCNGCGSVNITCELYKPVR